MRTKRGSLARNIQLVHAHFMRSKRLISKQERFHGILGILVILGMLMSRIARVLEKRADARKYADLFERIKKAFIREYVTPKGRVAGNTQTAYVLALRFDLLPRKLRKEAVQRLVADIADREGHLSTGFLGAGYLLPVLTDAGRLDEAYRLLLEDTYPSWVYPIRHGATTIWERWDGWTEKKGFQDPEMNSFNHYAFGFVGEWLYHTMAGLDVDPAAGPGYKRFIIRPMPGGGLTHARAAYRSIHGRILSQWRIKKGHFELKAVIPPNTRASIYLPCKSSRAVTESGKPLSRAKGILGVKKRRNGIMLEVGSGTYLFSARMA